MRSKMFGKIRIAQYTMNGTLVKIWDTQKEASLVTGISNVYISMCCYGRMKSAGGYRWSFI